MNTITIQELKAKIENKAVFQLIDIREDYEYDDFNIGGINIPMDDIFSSLDQIDKDKEVIFLCNSGKRSKAIIHTLKRKLQLEDLYSVNGGISEYKELV
ncbi:MAG: rhodanese-like domain-containing protein [Vicingaceae bacterium]